MEELFESKLNKDMVYVVLDKDAVFNIYHSIIFDNDGFVRLYTSPEEYQMTHIRNISVASIKHLEMNDAIAHISYINEMVSEILNKDKQ
jgi:hypothetical protein